MTITNKRYQQGTRMLERAERIIPLGAQTFSRSRVQFPVGHAPMFLESGAGGRVWDLDGNEYIDLICGLLSVILGYRDPDVDRAICQQLEKGISFSMATALEVELAERLTRIIPCAEMVRFGKNGSDVTTAAVRLARAVTGRKRIAASGYHGWHDWYIGATNRNLGVPPEVATLTHKFPYNDIEALDQLFRSHPEEFAAVIMEPMNTVEPYDGYMEEVQALAKENGALFILDEIITGFRFAMGGAQQLFGVTPDLATFGKSMGNGMPIAALVGKVEYMRSFEDIFFSTTFGGETLSLAAAIAVIDKIEREPVIDNIWHKGARLADTVQAQINGCGLSDVITIAGRPCWKILQFHDHPAADRNVIKTFFLTSMIAEGVLINASHNLCYAHSKADLLRVEKAYSVTLERLSECLKKGNLVEVLDAPVVRPVFAVR
ncbi:MAG: aminotransferase class III-fold pyridoxal phosphate-dependent enzyme [Deltaproteobacteria bacterium]|nr:aminotransferase class III-fold pyridoxal phosphate-dependent enzyme [Deltaproteobacteria bacterium]MBW2152320.1 aminotransferase class III-fold pyridoxal phosphate-dependent enzyme [Deltaproteobacteria bacterium]